MWRRQWALGVGHTVAWCWPTTGVLRQDGTPTHMLSEPFAARRSELQVFVICSTGGEQRRPQGRSRASSSSNVVLSLDELQDAFQHQLACCSCARTCLPAVVLREFGGPGARHAMFAHHRPHSSGSAQFCGILGQRRLAPFCDEKKHEAIAAARQAEATAETRTKA